MFIFRKLSVPRETLQYGIRNYLKYRAKLKWCIAALRCQSDLRDLINIYVQKKQIACISAIQKYVLNTVVTDLTKILKRIQKAKTEMHDAILLQVHQYPILLYIPLRIQGLGETATFGSQTHRSLWPQDSPEVVGQEPAQDLA